MSTFKAAYIPDDGSSTSGGLLLTTEDESMLSDHELMALAMKEAANIGLDVSEDEISIGEWND